MANPSSIDGVLVQWGERLFYPGNRIVKVAPQPHLAGNLAQRAAAIRRRIQATAVRRAPQVMVKVTGGGRGMKAIAAHFRYISEERPARHRRRARPDLPWPGGRARARRGLALRRNADRRRLRPPRGVQHHAVDAARHRRPCRSARRARVRPGRAGRAQVRHGAARPPGQPARAHQRPGGVQARQAPPPEEGRPAPLERDLRRKAPRLGDRCRGDPAGGPRARTAIIRSSGASARPRRAGSASLGPTKGSAPPSSPAVSRSGRRGRSSPRRCGAHRSRRIKAPPMPSSDSRCADSWSRR